VTVLGRLLCVLGYRYVLVFLWNVRIFQTWPDCFILLPTQLLLTLTVFFSSFLPPQLTPHSISIQHKHSNPVSRRHHNTKYRFSVCYLLLSFNLSILQIFWLLVNIWPISFLSLWNLKYTSLKSKRFENFNLSSTKKDLIWLDDLK